MSSPSSSPQLEQASSFAVPGRPTNFLSLAPTTSSTYPQAPDASRPLARRSSSVSSSNSNAAGLQFLRLGPVHYGEHPDDRE
ncbi:hypothetical protein D7B24_006179 [Verticillium nonalfalfae]|uniref:Uncharacterized protein n=1 Tax=Verticillium nonalfalfae TaxID=1051616 RepID=A0A3M9YBB7_9PEZI|nr:uncharacterized protein D7B24_006179 [Verticillium nonalfalfae]RNJ57272.1 hypothetical protein D7B24_006179 [Verticillium nonalfalfae]